MRIGVPVLVCAMATTAAAYPDMSAIRHEIRMHIPQIRKCYDAALSKDPKLEGTVQATFTLDRTGKVIESTATGLANVDACVAATIRKIRFPANAKGDIVIHYPFVFRPE